MTQDSFSISDDVSVMDDSTRERISKVAIERKKSINSRQSKNDRKHAIFNSTDKWVNPLHSKDIIPPSRRPSLPAPKKKKPKGRDEMSVSEHTGRDNKADGSEEDKNGKLTKAERIMKAHEVNGKLGNYLGQMNDSKPLQKRGARTVASVPTDSPHPDSPPKRGSSERKGRSKSPGALQSRTGSPGPMKRRTASPGPMKKRPESPGPMKDSSRRRTSSPGPLRKTRSVRGRNKGTDGDEVEEEERTERTERVSRPGDNGGHLEKLLKSADPSNAKTKQGAKSVASAPAVSRKDSQRRPRRHSRGPLSPRRSLSTKDEPVIKNEETESPSRRRRARSVDDFPIVEDSEQESPKGFSAKLSKRLLSFKKFTGFGGSGKTSATHQGDSSSIEAEQAPKRKAGQREQVRSHEKPKRSSSAGPLMNRAGKREDRRAALTQAKRNNSIQAKADEEEKDDQDRNRPPQRAQSMMLHREATRRGKSDSLMDLVNYSEEEIHSTSYFASNHVLVNRERMKRGLRPLTRNIGMDELARQNAEKMARSGGVSAIPATYVGNVFRGESIRAIHRAVMQNKEGRERANLLSPYFQDFGVGTSKGEDGMLYVCQLFSERLELTITDTTIPKSPS